MGPSKILGTRGITGRCQLVLWLMIGQLTISVRGSMMGEDGAVDNFSQGQYDD